MNSKIEFIGKLQMQGKSLVGSRPKERGLETQEELMLIQNQNASSRQPGGVALFSKKVQPFILLLTHVSSRSKRCVFSSRWGPPPWGSANCWVEFAASHTNLGMPPSLHYTSSPMSIWLRSTPEDTARIMHSQCLSTLSLSQYMKRTMATLSTCTLISKALRNRKTLIQRVNGVAYLSFFCKQTVLELRHQGSWDSQQCVPATLDFNSLSSPHILQSSSSSPFGEPNFSFSKGTNVKMSVPRGLNVRVLPNSYVEIVDTIKAALISKG